MNRNPDRQTRSSRNRAGAGDPRYENTPLENELTDDFEEEQTYGRRSGYEPPDGYEAPSAQEAQPRRRRSQAERLRAQTGEIPISPLREQRLFDAQQRYARPEPPQPAAPERKRNVRYEEDDFVDPYDDELDERDPLYEDDYDDDEPPRKKSALRWIIIGAVILAVLLAITFVGLRHPEWIEGPIRSVRELVLGADPTPEPTLEPTPEPQPTEEPIPDATEARVMGFLADPAEQPDISQPITFQVTTSMETTQLEIMDNNGQLLFTAGEADYTDNEYSRVWMLRVFFEEPYEGYVEASPGNASGWNDSAGQRILVKVGDVSAQEAQETTPPVANSMDIGGLSAGASDALGDAGFVATPVQVTSQAYDRSGPVTSYMRQNPMQLGSATDYIGEYGMRGVLTFRGSNLRQNAAYGLAAPTEKKMELTWSARAGIASSGDGSFGSQPLVVQWHQNIRVMMALNEDKLNVDQLKEVIFAGNDGNLYFYDLDDGLPTRSPLQGKFVLPMLGTPAIYPLGYPLLVVGSGDPAIPASASSAGMVLFNLIKNADIGQFSGYSQDSFSTDTTYITSPLIDNRTDTTLFAGGNGLLFSMSLNMKLDEQQKTMVAVPSTEGYRAGVEGEDTRVDNSLAAYGELAYYATNGGILQCVNLNTLTPVWALNVGADTDASVALHPKADGSVALYHASKADIEGLAHLRCIDAKTGTVIWDISAPGTITASPLVGAGVLDGFVFYAAANTDASGTLYAVNASTGAIVWQCSLTGSRLSSPLALYDGDSGAWIVQGDEGGLLLLNAQTGEQLDRLTLDGAVYGSPVAFRENIVVATVTGQLHCVKLR